MELAAARRPFLYFPLRDHFEQNRHVRHRLERYGAGRYMDYDASPPEVIAEAIAAEIDRPIDYRPVETDGAARAAALIAPLDLTGSVSASEPAGVAAHDLARSSSSSRPASRSASVSWTSPVASNGTGTAPSKSEPSPTCSTPATSTA